MRVVEKIPHNKFVITLFVTDKEFTLQIEAGPMIQSYKFSKEIYPNALDVKNALTEEFLDKTHDLFNTMFLNRKSMIDA